MLNSKKVEDLGLVKGACKGIERAGFTVIASEYPSDMGVPFFHIISAIWVRVRIRVTGNTRITTVLLMGTFKTWGCPYHCDTGR